MESITSFFFNIVPGALLVLVLEKTNLKISQLFSIDLSKEPNLFWLIIFSVFIGFLLQALTKLVKELIIYWLIFLIVKHKDKNNFNYVKNYLIIDKKLLSETESKTGLEKMFFIMDNYISFEGPGRLLPHFATRLAYWFNLFWVSLIIVFLASLNILNTIENKTIVVLSWFTLAISSYETSIHLYNHYDILLKTFISYIKINKENDSNLIVRSRKK